MVDTSTSHLGGTIREAREKAGLTQRELSARTGSLHQSSIALIERGMRIPSIQTLIAIASVLRCSPGDLLDGRRTCSQCNGTGVILQSQLANGRAEIRSEHATNRGINTD